MAKPYQKVIDYFSTLESKLGYDLVLGGVKHFGYYPSGKMDISEKEAQVLTQDLLAKKLKISKKDHLLDAGCGQGYVATYFAQRFSSRVTGITITPFEVKKARNLARIRHIEDKVDFLEMDYSQTQFPDNSFDAIYTIESFVHAYNLEKALKELKRILKPGGRIVFFEYSLAEAKKIKEFDKKKSLDFEKLTDWVIEKGAMFSLKKFRHGVFPKIIRKAGFTNIKEENITKYIKPSLVRLYRLSIIPYKIVKFLNLRNIFFNTTVAGEWFKILLENEKQDFVRYNVTSAQKP